MDTFTNASNAARRTLTPGWGLVVLCLALLFSACGSSNADGPPNGLEFRDDSDAPISTLEESVSFSRPVEPFETEVIGVALDGQINVIDTETGDVLASHTSDLMLNFARTTSHGGVIYLTDPYLPDVNLLARIDSGGIETVELATTGGIAHLIDAPRPTLFARSNVGAELIRFGPEAQIERQVFDIPVFLDIVGTTTLMTDPDHAGDLWLLDDDLSTEQHIALGSLDGRPVLIDEETVRYSQAGQNHHLDLTTLETSLYPESDDPFDPAVSKFAGGWTARLNDGVITFIDPAGVTQLEQPIDVATQVNTFAHPSEEIALVSIASNINREGVLPADTSTDGQGLDDTSDYGGIYVPPSFISVFQFDLTNATLTPIEVGETSTSIAALALDSGWYAVTVDGANTRVLSVSSDGASEILDEFPNGGADHTSPYVQPIGPRTLAMSDFQSSSIVVMTSDGAVRHDGVALADSDNAWRQFADTFAHIR